MIEGAIGLYLVLPGIEDVGTAGATVGPSVLVGVALLADAFNLKL